MILLSHPLTFETPGYGGNDLLQIESLKDMERGDSSNSLRLTLTNHSGTHIDAPKHFVKEGKSITDFSLDFWEADGVEIVELPKIPDKAKLLEKKDLPLLPSQAEALFLKTGFGKWRDKRIYWEEGPGFIPELADDLRVYFPRLKFFGFDLISLSSFQHREIGRAAHRAFLSGPQPILLLEDMNLSQVSKGKLSHALISPLFISGADAAPCTVWVEC